MNRAPPPRPPPRTKAAARVIQAALRLGSGSEASSAPDSAIGADAAVADAKLVFLPAGAGELLPMPRPGGLAADGTDVRPSPASAPKAQPPGAAESTRQEQAKILDQIDKRIAEREESGYLLDRRGSRRWDPSKLVGDEELLAVAVRARAEEEATEFHAIYMTPDIYSMAIFAGAGYCRSELAKLWIFVIALACFVAQVGSLFLAIIDLQPDDTSLICCTKLLGHPVNVPATVRAGQWLAVIFSIFSLENIICIDTLAFLNAIISRALYPHYQYEKQEQGENLFAFAAQVAPVSFLTFALMRIAVGLLTLITSIIIIVQTEENTTLFADFAALNVIASLDNLVFISCQMRFLGHAFDGNPRNIAKLVETTRFHAEDFHGLSFMLRCFVLVFLLLPAVVILGVVHVRQTAGVHCPEITVSTGLEVYPGLSGLYRWDGTFSNQRAVYRQLHPSGYDFGGKYRLVHCGATEAWTFIKINDREDAQLMCQTNWMIMSEPDESFDIFNADSWVYITRERGVNPAPDLMIDCTSCEEENELVHCNRGGSCVDGRCQCREGGWGPTCALAAPCRVVRIEGNSPDGFGGKYRLLETTQEREDPPDVTPFQRMPPWYRGANKTVTASMRPVYLNRCSSAPAKARRQGAEGPQPPPPPPAAPPPAACTGLTTILFHDGVGWLLARPSSLSPDLDDQAPNALLETFFDQFHPGDYSLIDGDGIFYSSPTPGASPEDAEGWFRDGLMERMVFECEEADLNQAKFIAGDSQTDFFPGQGGGGSAPPTQSEPPSTAPAGRRRPRRKARRLAVEVPQEGQPRRFRSHV